MYNVSFNLISVLFALSWVTSLWGSEKKDDTSWIIHPYNAVHLVKDQKLVGIKDSQLIYGIGIDDLTDVKVGFGKVSQLGGVKLGLSREINSTPFVSLVDFNYTYGHEDLQDNHLKRKRGYVYIPGPYLALDFKFVNSLKEKDEGLQFNFGTFYSSRHENIGHKDDFCQLNRAGFIFGFDHQIDLASSIHNIISMSYNPAFFHSVYVERDEFVLETPHDLYFQFQEDDPAKTTFLVPEYIIGDTLRIYSFYTGIFWAKSYQALNDNAYVPSYLYFDSYVVF